MADQKLTALTAETAPESEDLLYIVIDPSGVPTSRKITLEDIIGGGLGYGGNLIKANPGQIYGPGVDGNEPNWWDDSAQATLTDEDTAGEGIADKTERVFKCVTTADDHYGYQTLTFADEDLLDAGQTVVSLGVWVYCAAANTASIGIYGTNLGLQESSQHTGGASWEYLTVEGITLNAADASIEVRLICDTGTAYFTMMQLNVGPFARPWKARRTKFIPLAGTNQLSSTGGDVAWSDTDCTANTDPLAMTIAARVQVNEPNGTVGSYFGCGHDDGIMGADGFAAIVRSLVLNQQNYSIGIMMCDDSQIIRYTADEADADNDLTIGIRLTGYWMWD